MVLHINSALIFVLGIVSSLVGLLYSADRKELVSKILL